MTLTKSFYYKDKENNRELNIEFSINGDFDYDENEFFLEEPVVIRIFDEDSLEEVELEDVDEIVAEYVEKNYKKLVKQINLD